MNSQKEPVLQVAAKAAIINGKGQVLIVREAVTDANNTKVGKWGLVGGRLNPGEAFEEGLRREVKEETGLLISPRHPIYVGEWRPTIKSVQYQIVAIFVYCKAKSKEVRLSPEHDDYQWINPTRRTNYPMMEPDCFVVDQLV